LQILLAAILVAIPIALATVGVTLLFGFKPNPVVISSVTAVCTTIAVSRVLDSFMGAGEGRATNDSSDDPTEVNDRTNECQ